MLKWIGIVILAVVLVGFLGFYIWSEQTYSATEELLNKVKMDEDPLIKEKNDWLIFNSEDPNGKGLILYPGAKVEVEAYGYIGKSLSEKGYTVVIPKMPFHIAFLGINESEQIMDDFDESLDWYVSGHSLGGVAAASYAYEHQSDVNGVIFLASYPVKSSDFSEGNLPMLSIYAEKDGLTTGEDIEESKALLPSTATFHQIKGGNHAGFGVYGPQKGDRKASIPVWEQQDEIIQTMNRWMKEH
ncbi:alpha/beta hydrolase [Rossellomorea aquimaris]|uniref:alpha/beta hydrolase n=1 Tax=Rossellomorea aquimaris TaxID=189382 RepID=UPI001CD2B5CC|nr:alpha/beta hydrolase [Rossellomorea aquimaris]MCA1059729.1 alpha/beta hydrolase [Rossellomorea aquimaris]